MSVTCKVFGNPQIVKIPSAIEGTNQQYQYFTDMLKLALSKTEEEFGKAELQIVNANMVQERQLKNLENSLLDVMWSVTTVQREVKYLPIYIPLSQGLFGYRVFLIHQQDRLFNNDELTLQKIKRLSSVQGVGWPDTKVLKDNGFNVTVTDYASAFKLLEKQFINYFPRGVNEVKEELDNHPSLKLEKHHVLVYPNLMYFFVKKGNLQLAWRIEQGLERAKLDGSFDTIQQSSPIIMHGKKILENRHIHFLKADVSRRTEGAYIRLLKENNIPLNN